MTDEKQTKEWLTVEEAAEEIRMHPQTVRRWIRDGRLPAKKLGRVYRFRRADFDAALAADDGESAALGSNRDLFKPETLGTPYRPHDARPSVWEANSPVRAGE